MPTKEVKLINLKGCARCGQAHPKLKFKQFEIPILDSDGTVWNYWAICRLTREPILMKIVERNDIQQDNQDN